MADRNCGNGERTGNEGKREIDELLNAELEKSRQEVREVCPKGAPIDVLLLKQPAQGATKVVFGRCR